MYPDFFDSAKLVAQYDPEVADAMDLELGRQRRNIELIASENFVSPAVMAAMGSVLTNKYAEGYPGKRYYGGCEYVDIVENLAIERAKELFGADCANVQPHSGAQANMAAYSALINPGDTVMGMSLAHGGHLTHGSPVNASGKLYKFVPYGVNDDGYIDYDELEKTAKEVCPKLIVAGASAYPRVIDFERIGAIAKSVGAYFMVDMAHIAGLVAAGLHPSPVPYADVVTTTTHKTLRGPRGGLILSKAELGAAINKAIFPGNQGGPLMHESLAKRGVNLVSGGTDNHLILLDLRSLGVTGKDLEKRLDEVNITANKNAIPNDPETPFVTSGLRLGTAAATTRGLDESDMDKIAEFVYLAATDFENSADAIRVGVAEICAKHPLYE